MVLLTAMATIDDHGGARVDDVAAEAAAPAASCASAKRLDRRPRRALACAGRTGSHSSAKVT